MLVQRLALAWRYENLHSFNCAITGRFSFPDNSGLCNLVCLILSLCKSREVIISGENGRDLSRSKKRGDGRDLGHANKRGVGCDGAGEEEKIVTEGIPPGEHLCANFQNCTMFGSGGKEGGVWSKNSNLGLTLFPIQS